MSITQTIVDDVIAEIIEAEAKFGRQYDVPDGTGMSSWAEIADRRRLACQRAFQDGMGSWRLILNEEIAEAFAQDDPARLRAELLQVAAVALRWIDAIDERSGA